MQLKPASKVTLIYLLIGVLWIFLSDRLLFVFFDYQDEVRHILFQNIKGFFYISVTAFLLYRLMKSYYSENDKKLVELESREVELLSIQKITKTGNWIFDVKARKVIWSKVAAEIFEIDDNYIKHHQFLIIEHIESQENKKNVLEALETAEKKGISFDFILQIVTSKGNAKTIRLVGNPIMDKGRCTKIIGSYQDITELQNRDDRIDELSRLYSVISDLNKAIVRATDAETLFREACEIAVNVGLFKMAWIGMLDDMKQNIVPFVFAGKEDGYLSMIRKITNKNEPEGRGPTGSAIREGKYFVCGDIENDPSVAPWRNLQLERGYRSSISLPIYKFGKVIGAFTMYSAVKNFFNNQEIELLKDATADLSYALESIEKEKLRKEAELKVREALERYDVVAKATSDTIWDCDVKQQTIIYNQGINTVFGYEENQVDYSQVWREQNIHVNNREYVANIFREAFLNKEQIVQTEYQFLCADGSYKFILDRAFIRYDEQGNPERVIGTMQDITYEMENEIKVEKAVIRTQENERQQIGMELHDNVNQILSVSLLYLGMSKENLTKGLTDPSPISKSEQYIKEAINEIRRLSHELAPVSLKDISLQESFEILINSFNYNQQYNIALEIEPVEKQFMTADLKINLYRVLQEQLNNITKYAEAKDVLIQLTVQQDLIQFTVSDNGKGFNTKLKSRGIGLENIRRRVKLFSGDLKIISSPGNGCTLQMQIPLKKD